MLLLSLLVLLAASPALASSSAQSCSSNPFSTPYTSLKSPHSSKDPADPKNLGLLPRGPQVAMPVRVANLESRLNALPTDLDRYTLLASVLETDSNLYFATVSNDVPRWMPMIYTPTVGAACQNFSKIHTNQPKGIYLTKSDKGNIAEVLKNWPYEAIKVIVVTDGERILGLGDLGANGMGISIGKLALYTALGGIAPESTLPVHIDFGCNVAEVRDDPMYMGLRTSRPSTPEEVKEYDEFLAEFFEAVKTTYGESALVQFEDFGNSNAFRFLEMFQQKYTTFNDDIQGTASVVLGGIMASLRLTSVVEGGAKSLKDHTFLFFGAGEAGCGIAGLIAETIRQENPGMSIEEARKNIWLVDSRGLVTAKRDTAKLAHHKLPFAHAAPADVEPKDLLAAVQALSPTALIGVSGQPQTFSKEIVQSMTSTQARPIIFSLSNPTSKSECTAEQAYEWSDGKAIFATGSPFAPVTYKGKEYITGQGNNAYIFPGVGLGAIFSQASRVDDNDMITAARALAGLVPQENLDNGSCYPNLELAREVSVRIAVEVAKAAWERGTAKRERVPGGDKELEAAIRDSMWAPRV